MEVIFTKSFKELGSNNANIIIKEMINNRFANENNLTLEEVYSKVSLDKDYELNTKIENMKHIFGYVHYFKIHIKEYIPGKNLTIKLTREEFEYHLTDYHLKFTALPIKNIKALPGLQGVQIKGMVMIGAGFLSQRL